MCHYLLLLGYNEKRFNLSTKRSCHFRCHACNSVSLLWVSTAIVSVTDFFCVSTAKFGFWPLNWVAAAWTPLIRLMKRLCFTTWKSYAQSLLRIYRTVTCVLLDCLSSVEENCYLKRAQHKKIQHQWMLMLLGHYHCFNFWSTSFPLKNSLPKRLLLQMTLQLLANYQALMTTEAN